MLLNVYLKKSRINNCLDNIQFYMEYLDFNKVTSGLIKCEDKSKNKYIHIYMNKRKVLND